MKSEETSEVAGNGIRRTTGGRVTTGSKFPLGESKVTLLVAQLGYVEETRAIDNTMAKVTGNSRYYKILLTQGSLYMLGIGLVLYSIGFFNCLPNFKCPDGPNGEFIKVPEVEACKRLDVCQVSFPYHGWVEHYNMICDQRSSRVFYTSLIFFINAVVFFTLNALSDLLGRNIILISATLVAAGGTVAIWLMDNYIAKILTIGLVTGTTSVFQMMFTLGLKESTATTTGYNIIMNAFLNIANYVSPIIIAGLALYFTTFKSLSLVSLCVLVIVSIPNFFIYIETPLYLYRKRRGREFIEKMHDISSKNQVKTTKKSLIKQLIRDENRFKSEHLVKVDTKARDQEALKLEPITEAHDPEHEDRHDDLSEPPTPKARGPCIKVRSILPDIKDENDLADATDPSSTIQKNGEEVVKEAPQQTAIFNEVEITQTIVNYKRLGWITFVLCYWTASLYLISYGTLTALDKSGMDNIYVNSALFGFSNMCGYGISLKFPKNANRIKTMTVVSVSLLLAADVILLLGHFSDSISYSPVLQSICTVGIMPILVGLGFAVLYLYLPDAYPVTLRGVGIGIVICMGKIGGGMGSPYIANWMLQQNLNPIAGLAVPSFLLLILMRTIPAR